MALPSSGPISVSDIQREMDATEGASVSLSSLAAQWKSQTGESRSDAPHKMSDWRGRQWAFLSITPSFVTVVTEGDTFTIQVTTNVSCNVTTTGDPVASLSPANFTGNRTITVTIANNGTQNSKGGTITIASGSLSETVTWTQAGGAVIAPPDDSGGGPGGGDPGGGAPGDGSGGGDGPGGPEIVGPA